MDAPAHDNLRDTVLSDHLDRRLLRPRQPNLGDTTTIAVTSYGEFRPMAIDFHLGEVQRNGARLQLHHRRDIGKDAIEVLNFGAQCAADLLIIFTIHQSA